MKKIKNIDQLRAEKKSLAQKQEVLEKKIAGQWKALKENTLHPRNAMKNGNGNGEATEEVLTGVLSFAGGILAKKVAHKISNYFSKESKN